MSGEDVHPLTTQEIQDIRLYRARAKTLYIAFNWLWKACLGAAGGDLIVLEILEKS